MMIKEAFLTASLVLVVFKSCSTNVSGPQNRSARAMGWCQTSPVDFLFLVDASGSHNRKYIIQPSINLVNGFTNQLATHYDSTRNNIGMICFSHGSHFVVPLQPLTSGLYFDCQNPHRSWDSYRLIRNVLQYVVGLLPTHRKTIVILLTRGADTNHNPIPIASTLKHNPWVTIAVVDMINQGYIQQLQSIATSSAYYIYGATSDLHQQRLVSAVCHLGLNYAPPGQGSGPGANPGKGASPEPGASPGKVTGPAPGPSQNPNDLKKGTTGGSTGDKLLPLWIVLGVLAVVGIAVGVLFVVVMLNRKKKPEEPLKVIQVVAEERKMGVHGGRGKKASLNKPGPSLLSETTDGTTRGSVAGRQFPNMQQAAKGRVSQPKGRGKK